MDIASRSEGRCPGGRSIAQPSIVPLHVLVVDDDVDAAESVARHLETHGHKTRKVRDGLAVLDAARKFLPDVILLNTGSAGGGEAAALVRRESQFDRTLLVAVTGWNGKAQRRACKAGDGADFHFSRPIANGALMEVLARLKPRHGAGRAGQPAD